MRSPRDGATQAPSRARSATRAGNRDRASDVLRRMTRTLVAALLCLLLAACTGAASGPSDFPNPSAPTSLLPSPTSSSQSPTPRASTPAGGDELVGTLGYDGIEGGCPYVEAADGTRYQVQYPDGYSIDPSSGDLIGPDGSVVAPLGSELALRGVVRGDVGSICQIGPIFEAFEVQAR